MLLRCTTLLPLALAIGSCGRLDYESRVECTPVEALVPATGDDALITDFELEWTTAKNARLRWNTTASSATFDRYELMVWKAGACESVEALGGEAYPHMDFYLDPVIGALTNVIVVRDLDPSTSYQVQLQRVESDGSRSGTEILDLSTQEPPEDRFVIFDEAETPGYSIPGDFILATRFPFRGDHHYEFQDPGCTDRCFENLRRQNLEMVFPEMNEADVERAYFEFSIALEQATPSYYSQARLWWNSGEDRSEQDLAIFERFTIPALGRYVTYQIPLRAMRQDEGVFTELADIQAGLHEFTVGGDWDATALVSIDEVSIRW